MYVDSDEITRHNLDNRCVGTLFPWSWFFGLLPAMKIDAIHSLCQRRRRRTVEEHLGVRLKERSFVVGGHCGIYRH